MGGKVIVVHSKAEWDSHHSQNAEKTIIVDFTATWCGPCRMIGPVFEQLSTEYESIVFLKVDVDEVEQVAALCGISAMPTFQVWQGGKKVDELVGAAKVQLEALIKKYA